MTKRIRVNKGDVFKADLGSGKAKYLQYVMLDPAQLNSEVIRVFTYTDSLDEESNLKEIVASEIEFYAHVVVKWGVEMGFWEKVGNVPIEKDFNPPYFRDALWDEKDIINGQINFKKSDKWFIWQAGQTMDDKKFIEELTEKYENYDLGIVKSPIEIIHRMKTGKYKQPYFT